MSALTRPLVSVILFVLLMPAFGRAAETTTWDGSSDFWDNTARWDNGIPQDGDTAVIGSGTVVIRSDSAALAALTLNGGTLTFTNWTTTLFATNVTIAGAATVTLPPAFTASTMSNRVHFVCSNFTLNAGGTVNADGAGYRGGRTGDLNGHGPGGGFDNGDRGGGGGFGGAGGFGQSYLGGSGAYGLTNAPIPPGSGGGNNDGGNGGGAVRIEATGTVTIDGTLSANGSASSGAHAGGGSGGSIYLSCDTFGGASTGVLRANGSNASTTLAGGGAGGRIAVVYNQLSPAPAVRIAAAAGTGLAEASIDALYRFRAVDGTLYLSDGGLLSPTLDGNRFGGVRLYMAAVTAWDVNSLTVSNCSVTFAERGFRITVTNGVRVDTGGKLGVAGDLVTRGGDLVLTNGGDVYIESRATNGLSTTYGALVGITGDVSIASGSGLYLESHPTDGGSPLVQAGNVTVLSGGEINASSKGYTNEKGPGHGTRSGDRGGAGGYGGRGGMANTQAALGGDTYGSVAFPLAPGSAGGGANSGPGGDGGGLVRIEAGGTVRVDGTIQADGSSPATGNGGSGSGGGISITCATFGGTSSGLISANGRSNGVGGNGGGSGGGRIAIHYGSTASPRPAVRFSTSRGTGYADGSIDDLRPIGAENGTVWLPDTNLLTEVLAGNQFSSVNLTVSGLTSWAVSSLSVSNASVVLANDGIHLTVQNDIVIGTNGSFGIGALNSTGTPWLVAGGNLTLTNGGSLIVYSGKTNGTGQSYGALVSITGDLRVARGSWVLPFSHWFDGGSVLFEVSGLNVASNGGFNAHGKGFFCTNGPGRGVGVGDRGGGGGYGGKGGQGSSGAGGPTYGSSNAPLACGSGGGRFALGGMGGGLVRISAAGAVVMGGTIDSNGGAGELGHSGGGSGGAIFIMCNTFSGPSTAVMKADGGPQGASQGGGGGGGRIAVAIRLFPAERAQLVAGTLAVYDVTNAVASYTGTVSVTSGLSFITGDAVPGTAFFITTPPPGTVIFVR